MHRSSYEEPGCLALLIASLLFVIGKLALWVVIATVPLWLVWNWIVPQVFPGIIRSGFALGHISLIQAFGLMLLTGIIFRAGGEITFGKQ